LYIGHVVSRVGLEEHAFDILTAATTAAGKRNESDEDPAQLVNPCNKKMPNDVCDYCETMVAVASYRTVNSGAESDPLELGSVSTGNLTEDDHGGAGHRTRSNVISVHAEQARLCSSSTTIYPMRSSFS
jgi:hypothetical protein